MPTQTEAGKAFEYAVLFEAFNYLAADCKVTICEDSSYRIARKCYELFDKPDQLAYSKAAHAAIAHLVELEARLQRAIDENDILELQIVPDKVGLRGDVRDVLFIRVKQDWEIGISAKNNHKAVKHSRLSKHIDFGKEWLELNCSQVYFAEISSVFEELEHLRSKAALWKNVSQKHSRYYLPILRAFKKELLRLEKEHGEIVPRNLLTYLIGKRDFYKVIKGKKRVEIQAFNFHGSLNRAFGRAVASRKIQRLRFPSRIIEITFKPNSVGTLFLVLDEGWQISFRIHSASSKVEPSLKFDVNLVGHPESVYSHHVYWS
jgi:hypothetical protein